MNIFKKIFKKRKKEKKPECWYNNAHDESGIRTADPADTVGAAGSANAYEAAIYESGARR